MSIQLPSKYGASVFSANYFLSVNVSKKTCLSRVFSFGSFFKEFLFQASPQRTTENNKDSFRIVMPALSSYRYLSLNQPISLAKEINFE